MKSTYSISGMTCGGCSSSIQKALLSDNRITEAHVDHLSGKAEIVSTEALGIQTLQKLVQSAGRYTISNFIPGDSLEPLKEPEITASGGFSLSTYKPLLLVVAFIAGIPLLVQWGNDFDIMLWMRHFMAGFFLAFSFFKLLDVNAFANSFSRYDLIAAQWKVYALAYPFIELALGIAYLLDGFPFGVNVATILIMGIGLLGVWRSVLRKEQIQCACLGTVFQLPMSTVTVIENLSMVLMAMAMIAQDLL